MASVTQILSRLESGESQAASDLLPMIYDELRKLAGARMTHERPDHTLQATALVHEAYMRLVDSNDIQSWDSRGHFFAAAAKAMQRILVDHARARATQKRGGDTPRLDIDSVEIATTASPDQLLALSEALEELAELDSIATQIVQLRYFAGMNLEQAASAIGISTATAYRHWNYARAWLHSHWMGDPPLIKSASQK